jgi:hypothetical protein
VQAPAPAKKKKSCMGCVLGILALLVVLFVLCAGGAALWYFKFGGAEKVAAWRGKVLNPMGEQVFGEPSPANEPPVSPEPMPSNEPVPGSQVDDVPPTPDETAGVPQETPPPTPHSATPTPPPPEIIVDRPALRAAKENAEVALKSLREATESAVRAGAERTSGQEMEAIREERRSAERAFQKAKSPSDFEAVAASARKGVSRALELKARAEKAEAPEAPSEGSGMRRSPAALPAEPVAPPPKQPKASFGFIFETPVDGKKLVLKVDGEKLVDQNFQATQGNYRFTKDFTLPPGKHHLRVAVHQPDGKVLAQEWDYDFQPGAPPVYKVVLEKFPRQLTVKKVQ